MPFDFTPYQLCPMPGDFCEIHDTAATGSRRIVAVVNGLLELDEQQAFTALFAAAPDLLAACRVALEWISTIPNYSSGISATTLRAAIAKAEAGPS